MKLFNSVRNNLVFRSLLFNKEILILAFFFALATNVCQYFFLIDLPGVIESGLYDESVNLKLISSKVWTVLLVCIFDLSYRYTSKILSAKVTSKVSSSIIEFYSSIKLSEFQIKGKDKIYALATSYLERVVNSLIKPLPDILNSILSISISFYIIFYNVGPLAIYLSIILFFVLGFIFFFTRKLTLKYGKISANLTESIFTITNFFLGNIKEVLINKNPYFYSRPLSKYFYRKTLSEGKAEFISNGPQVLIQTLIYLMAILLPLFFVNNSYIDKNIFIPSLATILLAGQKIPKLVMRLYRTTLSFINIWPTYILFETDRNYDIDKFNLSDNKIFNSESSLTKSKIKKLDSINISKLLIGYSTSNPVIYIDSLNIKAFSSLLISGKSGSGKTTFLETLIGLRAPLKGKTSFLDKNNNLIKEFSSISYIPQSFNLPASTIIDCLAFTNPVLKSYKENYLIQSKIKNILKICLIWDEFVFSLNDLQINLGNGCYNLSGGQRQRLAIARSLLFDSQIIVFDEATGALDKNTELKLIGNILSQIKNKTFIMVSHSKQLFPLFDLNYSFD